jgi:GH25 family lysozyme M1 (1,4-beta-N-acetylmuramidase)
MSHAPGHSRPDAGLSSTPGSGLQTLEPRLLLSASYVEPQDPIAPASAEQAEVVAQAAGDLTFGIDVSHWQGSINWNSVANDGIDFAFTKATEGVDYVDSRFASNMAGAHNAGLLVGGYHFATPYTGGVNDAADEASDYYDAISPYLTDGYLRPVLDFESGLGTYSKTQLTNWVHDFMNAFSSLSGGIVPIIYTGSNYANNAYYSSVNVYDLWLANWPTTPDFNNPPTSDGVWNGYDLWQYSDSEIIGGINPVDGDVYFGSVSEMVAQFGINTTPDDHGDDLASATPIAMPSTTAGVIGSLADVDWFEVNLTAWKQYDFSVLADGLSSAEIRLYSISGNQLDINSGPASGGTLAALSYTPGASQVFYLSVDSTGAGGYNLSVQEADDHGDTIGTATELVSSSGISGLQTATDKDYFHFTAVAGKQYDMSVVSLGLPDAVLNLYNSGGAIVSQQIGSGANPMVTMEWTAAADGEMYLAVLSNAGSLGDYILSLAESDPVLVGDLDGDGFVGITDLNIVLGNWNLSVPGGDPLADPSGDGFVGIEDLNIVLGNWNAGTPPVETAGSASQDEVVAEASGTQILGIDVSRWQQTVNWTTVATTDREFAFIRAVDRDGLLDTYFHSNIVNAKAAGILAGAYQFVTPWTDGYNDAVEEAALFADTIAPYITDGYLRPVIDIEAGPPHEPYPIDLDNTVLTTWVHDYMAEFVRLTGVEPLIYVNSYYAKNAFNSSVNAYDLWLARWTYDPDVPPLSSDDGVWNGFDFWQYSNTESVAGIGGNVDGDVFFGSVADLIADYGITIAPDDHGNVSGDATAVTLPSATLGELNTVMDADWFELTLDGGKDYVLRLLDGSLGEAEIGLYTPAGTLLASSTGPLSGNVLAEIQYTPSLGDTFYVKVSSTGETGFYSLIVHEADDHGDTIGTASELVSFSGISGLQSATDQDYFHFTAIAGKRYDMSVASLGLPDAALNLYNSSGTLVSQQTGSGANPMVTMDWTAAAGAEMYLAVSSDAGSLGDYVLTLAESDPVLVGDLDGDGFVGITDLNIVLGNWNLSVPGGNPLADPSGDGFVGIEDLNTVLGNWNAGTPPTAAASSAVQAESTAPSTAESATAGANEDRVRGLAIANWRSDTRSAFGDDAPVGYTPAIGLWEQEDEA